MATIVPANGSTQYWLALAILCPTSVLAHRVIASWRALFLAIYSIIHAGILTEERHAMCVFKCTIVHTILVFGDTFFVAFSCALISYIKTAYLAENRAAIVLLVSALILAILVEAVSTLVWAFESVLQALGLAEYSNAKILLTRAIIDAILIFRSAFLIAIGCAIISSFETFSLPYNRDAALIFTHALTWTSLVVAITNFPYAFYPPQEALWLSEYRDARVILCDAVIDSVLIEWSAFLIASTLAHWPLLVALYLAEDRHTRVVLTHTGIYAILVEASAATSCASHLLVHALLGAFDGHACIVFCLTVVQTVLVLLGEGTRY